MLNLAPLVTETDQDFDLVTLDKTLGIGFYKYTVHAQVLNFFGQDVGPARFYKNIAGPFFADTATLVKRSIGVSFLKSGTRQPDIAA